MSSLELHYGKSYYHVKGSFSSRQCCSELYWLALYIHMKFPVVSSPVTDPVINIKSHWLHCFQSSNCQLILRPCCSLSVSALWTSLCLKPKLTCFLSASVYCIEVHHKKLLSGKIFALHTAKRSNVLLISFFVHQSKIALKCWQMMPRHCYFDLQSIKTEASLQWKISENKAF